MNSQSSINDDGISLDGESKNSRVVRRISEDDFLPLGVLLREEADFRDAVVLERARGWNGSEAHRTQHSHPKRLPEKFFFF